MFVEINERRIFHQTRGFWCPDYHDSGCIMDIEVDEDVTSVVETLDKVITVRIGFEGPSRDKLWAFRTVHLEVPRLSADFSSMDFNGRENPCSLNQLAYADTDSQYYLGGFVGVFTHANEQDYHEHFNPLRIGYPRDTASSSEDRTERISVWLRSMGADLNQTSTKFESSLQLFVDDSYSVPLLVSRFEQGSMVYAKHQLNTAPHRMQVLRVYLSTSPDPTNATSQVGENFDVTEEVPRGSGFVEFKFPLVLTDEDTMACEGGCVLHTVSRTSPGSRLLSSHRVPHPSPRRLEHREKAEIVGAENGLSFRRLDHHEGEEVVEIVADANGLAFQSSSMLVAPRPQQPENSADPVELEVVNSAVKVGTAFLTSMVVAMLSLQNTHLISV